MNKIWVTSHLKDDEEQAVERIDFADLEEEGRVVRYPQNLRMLVEKDEKQAA
jgi:hypothetical protein